MYEDKQMLIILIKGLSKEGLFIFCGIFPTHPALAAAHISPRPPQPDKAGKALYLTRSGRNPIPFTNNLRLILNLLLTFTLKRINIVNVNRTRQPAFFIELRRRKHELLKGA